MGVLGCCNRLFSNVAMEFLGHCNKCFCNIAVLLIEMLRYIIFDVEAHNFRCCSICFFDVAVHVFNVTVHIFSMLRYIFFVIVVDIF
jgi:hypothetical protein